ncbi:putative HTH-type transcriptional regulator YczG [Gordonia spumicola]|uniref:Putative HTH-type transcriptional regulator YczG n=1 Tax=Gordonia spumicola TaxID=589161 RepID=A0A7I9V8Y2_9ACTN|nr:helix-turn-helix domain-containing protein [Gordonia spumicola]GEE01550.1 putative HTH-type transcriptional regulator YczG [Gordonia spumicola]
MTSSDTVAQTPVADLQTVLSALADPVRLEMARRLQHVESLSCAALYESVTKATASHHFKILREAGVVERHAAGQGARYSLRADDVDAAFPGLLSAVLSAADAGLRAE